jgi:ubiquinone/menaquinone biosynthesis C-methylase UbiE
MSKENLIKDFETKQKTYFKENYLNNTKSNYVRRLRNQLINNELGKIKIIGNVLDVGCGPAILYEETLKQASNYYAFDIAESNLNQIKETNNKYDKIKYLVGDLDSFSFEFDFFDTIIVSGSIEYTNSPENNLKKLMSFLKPNGVLICSFPNKLSLYRQFDNLIYRKVKYIFDRIRGKKVNAYYRKLFSENKIKNDVFKAENEVRSVYFGMKFILSPFDYLLSSLDYFLTKKYEEKNIKFLRKKSSEYLLIVKK